jgi:hypothetical protein
VTPQKILLEHATFVHNMTDEDIEHLASILHQVISFKFQPFMEFGG